MAWSIGSAAQVLAATLLALGSLTAALPHHGITSGSRLAPNSTATCTSPICLQYAEWLKSSLAKNYSSIDPCTNFDQYTCGGYTSSHELRPDQSLVSPMADLAGRHRDLLHSVFENPYPKNSTLVGNALFFDQANFNKMKAVYNSCMDEEAIEGYGASPLKKLLDEFEQVYPITFNGSSTPGDLTKVLVWLAQRSTNSLIAASPGDDYRDPGRRIVSFSPGSLRLPKQYYNSTGVVANATKVTADMLYIFRSGKPLPEEPIPPAQYFQVEEIAKRIIDLEKRIADRTANETASRDFAYFYQVRPLSELEDLLPHISVTEYLKALVPAGHAVTPNTSVVIRDLKYYTGLSQIIQETSRETMHHYLQYQIIADNAGRLHQNYSTPLRRFNNGQQGQSPNAVPARWRVCLNEIDQRMGHALSSVFIQRAFPQESKELARQMIADLKQQFIDRLDGFDWMNNVTRNATARKVNKIRAKIGYQIANPNVGSPEDINKYYDDLHVQGLRYFELGVEFKRFSKTVSWGSLLLPTNNESLTMTAPTVNAYYSPAQNVIAFPAGILQYPFFHHALPKYVSYGSFGAVAGHELTHAFDSSGSRRDENGTYREWWDKPTRDAFNNKTRCFINQYGKYSVKDAEGKDHKVNGQLTLGENIADAGGLSVSYAEWKKRDAKDPDLHLPGLENFTREQLFFLTFASRSCAKVRPAEAVRRVLTDPHAPSMTRILGTVDNSVPFKEAFNCPVKKPTCEIW